MQTNITSKQNPRIVAINKLKIKKIRNETGLGIIEGERIIKDAINQNVNFETIVVLDSAEKKFSDIVAKSKSKSFLVVPKTVFDTISSTENSQGILAVVEIKEEEFVLPKSKFLLLDNIQDPGNLGTIIRTAVALGFNNIYFYDCVDFRNDKVLRSTMGTIFKAKLFVLNDEKLKNLALNRTLLLADAKGEDLSKFKPEEKDFGIVLCNEGNGASKEILEVCKNLVAIEMENQVESLNVSVAGAILMYALKSK